VRPRYVVGVAATSDQRLDRVAERRRAAALARHYRDNEDLSIHEIARRLGRAPATVKAYLYDPTGERARAVKARYRGVCRGCGALTSARNGKGDAYEYCWQCRPGAAEQRWTRELVLAGPIRNAAVFVRLVTHPRAPARWRRARAAARRRLALAWHRHRPLWNLGNRPSRCAPRVEHPGRPLGYASILVDPESELRCPWGRFAHFCVRKPSRVHPQRAAKVVRPEITGELAEMGRHGVCVI